MRNSRAMRVVVIGALLIAGACSGSGRDIVITPPPPPPPAQTATLSGSILIRDEEVETPVAGATISVGSVSTTSGQNGRFELANAPVGPAVVQVSAAGFTTVAQNLTIQTGTNSVTIPLLRANATFESDGFLVYIPSGVSTVRGVFFPIMGGSTDSRPLVRGDLAFYQSVPLAGDVDDYRRRMITFARARGLAIMGAGFNGIDLNPRVLEALTNVSAASGRPELALAPIVLHGHSNGACTAYNFTVQHPDRVIGFVIVKFICVGLNASPAIGVPGYLVFGELDTVAPTAASDMTSAFQQYRAEGAIWALANEPGSGHTNVADYNLLFNWLDAVVVRRLPETITPGTPVQLRALAPASGWLGDRTSRAIAAYACYSGNPLSASWLPSEQTARDWQTMVSNHSITTVTACPP